MSIQMSFRGGSLGMVVGSRLGADALAEVGACGVLLRARASRVAKARAMR